MPDLTLDRLDPSRVRELTWGVLAPLRPVGRQWITRDMSKVRAGLLLLSVVLAGCSVRNASTPPPTGPEAVGRGGIPTSGGTSIESAEPVSADTAIEGTVSADQRRYYRLDIESGTMLPISWYTRILTERGSGAGINPVLRILDAQGGNLVERMEATYATVGTGNFDQEQLSFTLPGSGPWFLQVECTRCGVETVHYKITLQ
jgi:hypothetical protein